MRRLVFVFALLLGLFAAANASAGAANPGPRLVLTDGSTKWVGSQLQGEFVVENRGRSGSTAERAVVLIEWGIAGKNPPIRRTPLAHAKLPSLAPSQRYRIHFASRIPAAVPAGVWAAIACVGGACRRVQYFDVSEARAGRDAAGGGSTTSPDGGGSSGPGNGGSSRSGPQPVAPPEPNPPSPPVSTIPTAPLSPPVGEPFEVHDPGAPYWAFVPETYDPSNHTATPLLIWLHGCYGEAEGEAWVVDPGEEMQPPQDWLTLTLAGREGGAEGVCWIPSVDEAKVMAALADFETHFNVDRRRVILGGYSSGGDLAYRTGFRHAATFAGLLIENSSPFRDTESTEAESLAAATTKFHIVHLSHLQDATYPIAGVRKETEAVKAAGFPIERIEVPGEHWNDEGDFVEGQAVPGTDADLRDLLLPHIDDGWLAPAP